MGIQWNVSEIETRQNDMGLLLGCWALGPTETKNAYLVSFIKLHQKIIMK